MISHSNFRELNLVHYADSETMNKTASEQKCDKAQGGDRDQEEDNLRDADVRALEVAKKEDPLLAVRDSGAVNAEAGAGGVGGAAGATTGCGDRGSLSSEEEEDMVSASSTLTSQRKVFSSLALSI